VQALGPVGEIDAYVVLFLPAVFVVFEGLVHQPVYFGDAGFFDLSRSEQPGHGYFQGAVTLVQVPLGLGKVIAVLDKADHRHFEHFDEFAEGFREHGIRPAIGISGLGVKSEGRLVRLQRISHVPQ